MKYLSVCSGIEAATVAWHSLGWEPLAFSEIEKFPRKVLAHHYPDVRLEGDFTVLREQDWIKDADILVGGTPCQAFSVAGLRNSLDDDRGNLTLEFVRLADAIDNLRRIGTIIVWENVPGVLSVKDNAFGCFLAALVGNDEPIIPTGGKWTNAGMVMGPKRRAAWRVLDAQYFGVAQRRRRVFVVASSRDGFDPAEVLFEREGLRRNTPPRREKGEKPSATIAARFGISRNNHEEVVTHVEDVAPTLTKEGTGVSRPGFQEDGWYVAQVFDRQRSDQYGESDIASTMSARDYKDATDLVAQPIAFNSKDYGSDATTDMSPTLRSLGAYGANGGGSMAVAQPIPINTQLGLHGDTSNTTREGIGIGKEGDPSFTLQAGHSHAVAQPIAFSRNDDGQDATHDLAPTMRVAGNAGGVLAAAMAVAQPIPINTQLGLRGVAQSVAQPTAYASSDGKVRILNDVMSTLDTAGESRGTNQQRFIHQEMAIRRLTPRECERLQGFPDDYTNIPGAADGPRYKALGNSMAVPVMAWIGKRIKNNC